MGGRDLEPHHRVQRRQPGLPALLCRPQRRKPAEAPPSRQGPTRRTRTGRAWTGEARFNEQWLIEPLRRRSRKRIFVCAHADLFHPTVPTEWIDRIHAVMALADRHNFQVLTKRSRRMPAHSKGASGRR